MGTKVEMTREQADEITKALNKDKIDTQTIENIVRQQIEEQGDCSPILSHFLPAMAIQNKQSIEKAAHELRAIWRTAQWKYAETSRLLIKHRR